MEEAVLTIKTFYVIDIIINGIFAACFSRYYHRVRYGHLLCFSVISLLKACLELLQFIGYPKLLDKLIVMDVLLVQLCLNYTLLDFFRVVLKEFEQSMFQRSIWQRRVHHSMYLLCAFQVIFALFYLEQLVIAVYWLEREGWADIALALSSLICGLFNLGPLVQLLYWRVVWNNGSFVLAFKVHRGNMFTEFQGKAQGLLYFAIVQLLLSIVSISSSLQVLQVFPSCSGSVCTWIAFAILLFSPELFVNLKGTVADEKSLVAPKSVHEASSNISAIFQEDNKSIESKDF